MESPEMLYLMSQLARPVEYDAGHRQMFDRALLVIGRDYFYMDGFVYFLPGTIVKRVNKLKEAALSLD